MSAETLPKTGSTESFRPTPSASELDDLFNQPSAEQNIDNRELSPTASRMRSAVDKVSTMFERRALNKAHKEALKEDKNRTKSLQSEAYDSYTTNIYTTAIREQDERREAREAKIEDAKDLVKKAGRSVLNSAANAGMVTLGVGLLAGEAAAHLSVDAARKTKDLAETGTLYAMSAADKVKDIAETGALKTMYAVDRGQDILSTSIESVRQELEARAKAAEASRQARRERWASLKKSMFDRGHEVVDSSKEKGRDALGRARAARAAGSAALSAIASAKKAATSTYNTHREQDSL